ncbi:MAG: tRNA (adenosine(37)-N6)-threonylcarbamoyltransferase complex dimerization subunit type 1 TsaB [Erysipelotrichaceae bacterium]
MLNLFIDTSYKYLTVVVSNDRNIIASYSSECFKRQSEELFMVLDNLFKENDIKKSDLNAVYITLGPGSYTGVRIALTLAKVLCSIKDIKLYTISTLKLYAGKKENCLVVMDARANRAYTGAYNKGQSVLNDTVLPLNEINTEGYEVILDGSLVGKENKDPDIINNFIEMMDEFDECEDIDHLTPVYLKESDAYYR